MVNFFLKLATTRFGGWFFTTVTPPLDRLILRLSRGRFSIACGLAPIMLLNTTGRRSGKLRSSPLLYLRDGETIVVLGSRGGRRQSAAWYLNLCSNPRASVLLGGRETNCRAREAEGSERDRLWQQLAALNPGINTYQQRLQRRIPVMVLTPDSGTFF